MQHYLTFDIGTTALKTALVREDGRAVALHSVEYSVRTPRATWAEMAPERYWQAALEGTRAVLAGASVVPAAVAAIGFSSQGQSFLPIDLHGQPLAEVIVWMDDRAREIAEGWEAEWLSREEFRRISGYPWLPASLTVFKVAWLAQHCPAAHRAWKFLCLPDYLIYRFTGETATDFITARMSGFYDLQSAAWEPRLLTAAGITAAQLPTVLPPGTVAGTLNAAAARALGLPADIPVCVGANDQVAGALGAGNVRPGCVTETTGSALALIATTTRLLDDRHICVGRHAIPELSYAMTFTNTAAVVLKWLRDLLAPAATYADFLTGVEEVPPGCDGLTALPHFAGTGTPCYNQDARGAFAGLTLAHTRAHLARAVMEACACALQECLEPLNTPEMAVTSVRSLGGAARSDAWLQMKADLLGVPIERPANADAASLGAAMLAAVGIGQFAGCTEAADAWYRPAQIFLPDAGRYAAYREVYGRYRELYNALYGAPIMGH